MFDVVGELGVPGGTVSIVTIEMFVDDLFEFGRIDGFPVAFEFLWVYLVGIDS